jgi:hypothetical protein
MNTSKIPPTLALSLKYCELLFQRERFKVETRRQN